MKIINVIDRNIKILELDRGDYLINGIRYYLDKYYDNRVELDKIDEVKKINTTNVIINYYDELNQKELTVEEYTNKINELKQKGCYEENGLCFNNLDDEYNYRKFKQNCKPNYKTIETLSDNLTLPEETIIYETDNRYISSCFFTVGSRQPFLYKYDRLDACLEILKNKFDKLGFEFKGNCGYNITANEKIWGNSESNGIRYAVAFGTYIFNDRYNNINSLIDTLDKCREYYKQDKKNIEEIIMYHYNQKYSKLDKDKLEQLPQMLDELQKKFNTIKPYSKSRNDYIICGKKISDIQKLIKDSFDS